jgi:NAD(P)H-dependent FMN reductase
MNIQIVIGSTRQSRATPRVAKWVEKTARNTFADAEIGVTDLKELGLPFFDEHLPPLANHDRQYGPEVKQWLEILGKADAVIVVTPEYNHGMPAVLKNAFDHVDVQVKRKPVALIGHGVVGGARAIEQLRGTLSSNIAAVVIPETVNIVGMVGFGELISEAGESQSDVVEATQSSLEGTLTSLKWFAEALKVKRDA